uniref:Probable molybdopterin-synthase adenylyltransferase n=1 Tax=Hildenbrandia rivularis TaxID=135206 RepID=A0A1C9CFN9_9FLOR|nr:molybdopterin biosynthesis protein [Hildenbrandia rivularis]AOM67185.1 molybdopterin biosynthesis protein [Hildenbrandia rivularis]
MLNPHLNFINLTSSEHTRYTQHLVLPYIEIEGQKRLKTAKILCIGIGGLGSSCLLYLAAAGIRNIGLMDEDIVDESNLQRQIIYQITDIGYKKIECAEKKLRKINPDCKIELYHESLSLYNTTQIIPKYDIIIDGTDNFKSKSIISHACFSFNKPHIYGAISQFEGHISVFNYQGGPLYQDLYSQDTLQIKQPICTRNGVLGALTGIIGTLQAIEVIKIIVGIDNTLSGTILIYNALNTSFKKVRLRKKVSCLHNYNKCKNSLIKAYHSSGSLNTKITHTVTISTQNLQLQPNILLVDVRQSWEYHYDHIKDSINIPLKKLGYKNILSFLKQQTRTKKIYIYCNTRSRSNAALSLLYKHGIVSYQLKFASKYLKE